MSENGSPDVDSLLPDRDTSSCFFSLYYSEITEHVKGAMYTYNQMHSLLALLSPACEHTHKSHRQNKTKQNKTKQNKKNTHTFIGRNSEIHSKRICFVSSIISIYSSTDNGRPLTTKIHAEGRPFL